MDHLAFWMIVAVGVGLLLYSLGSDRRNPPMAKCQTCRGEGTLPVGFDFGVRTLCGSCGGDGWVVR